MRLIPTLLISILLLSNVTSAQQTFPEKCLGTWDGTMKIYHQGKFKEEVPVRLTVNRTDQPNEYTWKKEYLSKTRPVTKDYKLVVKDLGKGIFITDEGGGVQLFNYLFENKLFNTFETGGVMLGSTYELKEDQLIFELTAGKKIKNEKDNFVTNYSVDNLQRIVFQRSAPEKKATTSSSSNATDK